MPITVVGGVAEYTQEEHVVSPATKLRRTTDSTYTIHEATAFVQRERRAAERQPG